MLSVTKYINNFNLYKELWNGALNTADVVIENNKFEELVELLGKLYPESVDITEINDLLWSKPEFIYEELNIRVDK